MSGCATLPRPTNTDAKVSSNLLSKVALMKSCLSIFALLAVYSSCVVAGDTKGIPLENDICSDMNARTEADVIKKSSNIVTRKGNKLFVKLQNGKTVTRTDVPCKESDEALCMSHEFWDFSVCDYLKDARYLLLEKHSYEYSEYELISIVDGSSLLIEGLPTFSHDAKRFIVNVNPIYNDFVSRLEVWRIDDGKFIQELSYEPQGWPSVDTKWANDDNEIAIREARCINDNSGHMRGYALGLIAKLNRKDSSWKVIKSH